MPLERLLGMPEVSAMTSLSTIFLHWPFVVLIFSQYSKLFFLICVLCVQSMYSNGTMDRSMFMHHAPCVMVMNYGRESRL